MDKNQWGNDVRSQLSNKTSDKAYPQVYTYVLDKSFDVHSR